MGERANASKVAKTTASIAGALESPQPEDTQSKQTQVSLPWERQDKLAVIVPNVLSEDECTKIIQGCERNGFEHALLNIGDYLEVLVPSVRKSERCIVNDVHAAELLWQRLQRAAPKSISHSGKSWHCVGLNERFRVLKYEPGDYFLSHTDGIFVRPKDDKGTTTAPGEPGDISYFTVMLYLNTPAKGGGINFTSRTDSSQVRHVKPLTGQALIFDHSLRHEGAIVEEGTKYAVRTDVMYRCSEHIEADRVTATSVFIPTKERPHGYMMKC